MPLLSLLRPDTQNREYRWHCMLKMRRCLLLECEGLGLTIIPHEHHYHKETCSVYERRNERDVFKEDCLKCVGKRSLCRRPGADIGEDSRERRSLSSVI